MRSRLSDFVRERNNWTTIAGYHPNEEQFINLIRENYYQLIIYKLITSNQHQHESSIVIIDSTLSNFGIRSDTPFWNHRYQPPPAL